MHIAWRRRRRCSEIVSRYNAYRAVRRQTSFGVPAARQAMIERRLLLDSWRILHYTLFRVQRGVVYLCRDIAYPRWPAWRMYIAQDREKKLRGEQCWQKSIGG